MTAAVTAADVSSLVTPWPPHLVVEVRVCAQCNRQMSRLQHAVRAEVVKRSQASQLDDELRASTSRR